MIADCREYPTRREEEIERLTCVGGEHTIRQRARHHIHICVDDGAPWTHPDIFASRLPIMSCETLFLVVPALQIHLIG